MEGDEAMKLAGLFSTGAVGIALVLRKVLKSWQADGADIGVLQRAEAQAVRFEKQNRELFDLCSQLQTQSLEFQAQLGVLKAENVELKAERERWEADRLRWVEEQKRLTAEVQLLTDQVTLLKEEVNQLRNAR